MIYELSGLGMKLNHMEDVVRGTNVGEIMQKLSDAENETTILQNEVDTAIAPQIAQWRDGVNEILTRFNPSLSIDYSAILAQSEKNFEEQERLEAAMASASGNVTSFLRHVERIAEARMENETRAKEAALRAVMLNQSLSHEERLARIAKINADFQDTQELIMEKAHMIAADQGAAGLSMQMQKNILNSLVAESGRRQAERSC